MISELDWAPRTRNTRGPMPCRSTFTPETLAIFCGERPTAALLRSGQNLMAVLSEKNLSHPQKRRAVKALEVAWNLRDEPSSQLRHW